MAGKTYAGKVARLIDDYTEAVKAIKELEEVKKRIRIELEKEGVAEKGTYISEKGNAIQVSTKSGGEIPPDVEEVFALFTTEKRKKDLFKVVQVVPKLLKDYVRKDQYEVLVGQKEPVQVWRVV